MGTVCLIRFVYSFRGKLLIFQTNVNEIPIVFVQQFLHDRIRFVPFKIARQKGTVVIVQISLCFRNRSQLKFQSL